MPVITDIVQHKKNKKYYSIYLDGKFRFSLSENDLIFLDLKKGQLLPQEKVDYLIQEYGLQKARNYVYSLISKKNYSENLMREKLKNKNYSDEIIEKIIDELKEYDYINDEKFIYEYAQNKIESKPMGRYRLKAELFNKKFDEPLIKECIEKIYQEYNERELAEKAIKLHFKKLPLEIDEKFVVKLKNFLLSRGFSFEIINEVISEIKNE